MEVKKKVVPLQPQNTEQGFLGKCLQRSLCGNSSVGRAQPCQGWGREFEPRFPLKFCPGGGMVDALVSGASAARRAGSSPVLGTKMERWRNGRRATLRG